MSAFNIVRGETACPLCGCAGAFEIQFKYGNTWQLEYMLGDVLRWGGNDIGVRTAKKVKVEGIGGKCPSCGEDMIEFDVLIEENVLKQLIGIGKTRQLESNLGYQILEE